MNEMQHAMHTAIQKVLHDHAKHSSDKGLLINWTLSMETLGNDGEPWLKHLANPGITKWNETGMLTSALDDCRTQMRESTTELNTDDDTP